MRFSSTATRRWPRGSIAPTARSRGGVRCGARLLTTVGTLGYYVAYGLIAWRTLRGDFTIGDLTFLAGAFRRLRTLLESLLAGFSQVAGQALYLDDLFSFFDVQPEIVSAPDARPFPVADPDRLRLRGRRLHLSGCGALGRPASVVHASRRRGAGAGRRERRGQDDAGQAAGAAVRPGRGAHPARRARPEGLRPGRPATEHRRDLPGLRALPPDGRRQHRRRSHRRPRRPPPHRRGRQAQPRRRRDRAPAAEVRPGDRQALPHGRGAVGRRMAEGRPSRAPTCATRSC